MTAANKITRVTIRLDDQAGVEPGWYAQTFAGDEFADDSQKVWFPVNVSEFAHEELGDLVAALQDAFPNAEIDG